MKETGRLQIAEKKVLTGINGFDEITNGGLPYQRSTLVEGGPGSGKTMFALQFVVNGIRSHTEPAIFVAFEEAPQRIAANFEGLGWQLSKIGEDQLFFLDARPTAEMVQSGNFDLSGLLAILSAKAQQMSARRIVFDALDVLLGLLPDDATRRREVYKVHEWLLDSGLTGVITAKATDDGGPQHSREALGFMQFMVDCSVVLNHRVTLGVSQRNLRVRKYRGSGFDENEAPFVIGSEGFDIARSRTFGREDAPVSNERVSSGVKRLDTMLGGGLYRGACALITGFPGTAKTSLSGTFAEASCKRGERTTFFSFGSDAGEVIRNLASIGIDLAPHVETGMLRLVSARTLSGSAETLLVHIKTIAKEHKTRCLIVDPISSLAKTGKELTAHGVAERLIDFAKSEGITLICTSLLDELTSEPGLGAPLQIGTYTDTWIHLSYLVQSGERNRGLSIVKSRGTAHSNQVRELVLTDEGLNLADIYTAGGEVLMGTLRWEKECAQRLRNDEEAAADRLRCLCLDAEEVALEARATSLRAELGAKRAEKDLMLQTLAHRATEGVRAEAHLSGLRGGDTAEGELREQI